MLHCITVIFNNLYNPNYISRLTFVILLFPLIEFPLGNNKVCIVLYSAVLYCIVYSLYIRGQTTIMYTITTHRQHPPLILYVPHLPDPKSACPGDDTVA